MTAALKIIQDNPDIGYSIGLKTFKYGKHKNNTTRPINWIECPRRLHFQETS